MERETNACSMHGKVDQHMCYACSFNALSHYVSQVFHAMLKSCIFIPDPHHTIHITELFLCHLLKLAHKSSFFTDVVHL